jgi:hypothetical protein
MIKPKGIAEKFNIEDIDPLEVHHEEIEFNENPDDDIIDDYRYIRTKLRHTIEFGEAVLNEAMKNVRIDPTPRAVEGCSTILKTIVESSKELLNVHKETKKMKKQEGIKDDKTADNGSIKGKLSDILNAIED